MRTLDFLIGSAIACLIVFAGTTQARAANTPAYDTVIRHGRIYDGSGKPPYDGDVAIQGDRIAYVGPHAPGRGKTELDAQGKALAPGFVNMLAHPEESLLVDGRALSDLRQGVTLEVMGELSMGPVNAALKKMYTEQQSDIHYDVNWNTLGEYLTQLQKKGIAPNIASFVSAGTVREYVLGEDNVQPNAQQLSEMRALVHQAMEEGALGVTTALIYNPYTYAQTPELAALATESGRCGGMYIAHMRSEGDRLLEAVKETIDIAKQSGAPAEIYHLKVAGRSNWGKLDEVIREVDAARAAGTRITADMYVYTAGATGLDASMPSWVQEGGLDKWIERLKDPATRAKVAAEMRAPATTWENLGLAAGPEGMLLLAFKNPALKPLAGKTLAQVAQMRGQSPQDTAMQLVVEDGSRVGVAYFLMNEDNIRRQVALPWVSFGSDAPAPAPEGVFLKSSEHPRAYGNFTRVLAKYVRDDHVIPLEEAIRKLSALPAENLSLADRGKLEKGYFADVVMFDPATVQDHSTYDNPQQLATGVSDVWVNGVQALKEGNATRKWSGRVVRGRAWSGAPHGGCRATSRDWTWANATAATPAPAAASVDLKWDVKIPLRDGVKLSATVYTPHDQKQPAPCIFTLTPYIAQSYHDRGMYFASHGYPFLTVDVRGRGNSEGVFHPLIQEAHDGYDVVEWLAAQPYCNGKVTMWGGSYAGTDQWQTAKEFPPHLQTIVPAAAAYPGVDFPMGNGIFYLYDIQWLTFTSGHTSQDKLFGDQAFWTAKFRQWYESGAPLKTLDTVVGNTSTVFQEWLAHPERDAYWDSYNPTVEQYAKFSIPILTITGSHDDDQPGALTHYQEYMKHAPAEARARHYLVIGPWDHAGTRTPRAEVGGLTFGPASLVDLPQLHLDWYAWTMQGGSKPAFLKRNVAYYVMFADKWRYADTLAGVTGEVRELHLDSTVNATDVLSSGYLGKETARGKPDHYVYDPSDRSLASVEAEVDLSSLVDQHMVYARRGKQLVYHSAPFERNTEVSGFFKLSAWLSIDQPDTDFQATIYEIRPDGSSLPLASQNLRARYREGLRKPVLIKTRDPLRYEFDQFNFMSQEIKQGSRLRLVITPINSIYLQKNYNSGGVVSEESLKDSRPVTVTLYHDARHPSTLFVPIGAGSDQ